MRSLCLIIVFTMSSILLGISSCKKNPQSSDKVQESDTTKKDTYFSLKQYYNDHINNVGGQPYTIIQMTSKDGKQWDSLMTDAFEINWNKIKDVFFKTDIGYVQFLNQYDFQIIKDTSTNRIQYIYSALNNDLKTKQLIITVDDEYYRVKGIQINTTEVSLTGKTDDLYQKWIFLTGDKRDDE
jgi:mannitol-specific phosphotransferase system IIBC component